MHWREAYTSSFTRMWYNCWRQIGKVFRFLQIVRLRKEQSDHLNPSPSWQAFCRYMEVQRLGQNQQDRLRAADVSPGSGPGSISRCWQRLPIKSVQDDIMEHLSSGFRYCAAVCWSVRLSSLTTLSSCLRRTFLLAAAHCIQAVSSWSKQGCYAFITHSLAAMKVNSVLSCITRV